MLAFRKAYTQDEVADALNPDNPVFNRDHVFDFHDGTRLIIVREIHKVPDGYKEFVHVSYQNMALAQKYKLSYHHKLSMDNCMGIIVDLFELHCNFEADVQVTQRGIHVFFESKELIKLMRDSRVTDELNKKP